MRAIWRIWPAMRNPEFDLRVWVQMTSCQCNYPPDRDSYQQYWGWSIALHTKSSEVPVCHHKFLLLLWCLTFLCSTLPSPKNMKCSHPSVTLHAIILTQHRVLHTPSTASSQDRQSSAPSQFLISWWILLYGTLYIPTITCEPINIVSDAVAPPSNCTTSKYSFNLARA